MKKKILIVEDEISLATVLIDKLSQAGYIVTRASNGEEGLTSALKEHPDLTLLDIIMPVMDGMTMLSKLRGDVWGKKAKVILLTNLSDAEKISKSGEQGVSSYLIKSDWTLDDIVKKVNAELD